MKSYHPFVFDEGERRFIGKFEAMYQAERTQGFDSWHQEDLRNLTRRICLEILSGYSFHRALDIGCGKGAFTQFLKRRNNYVVGIDLSETALSAARSRYPDIEFIQTDVASCDFDLKMIGDRFDLVVCMETLSYLQNWQSLLEQCSRAARWMLIALYVPRDPIGFVKSFPDLLAAFSRYFRIIEEIRLETRRQIVLFGEAQSSETDVR